MAASPVTIPSVSLRRPLTLTSRRLEANRRNAARSTGPRTVEGKAKVARNAIKHGFFAGPEHWSPTQCRDFEETLAGLLEEFNPEGLLEETWVLTLTESYVRMAAMLRYENIAALKHHQEEERELEDRIAAADPLEAEGLRAERDDLRTAGLWRPTIPGPRDAIAIVRYSARLDRAIRGALSELEGLKARRGGGKSRHSKMQKQTHYSATPNSGPEAWRRAYAERFDGSATPNSGPEAWRRAYVERFDGSAAPNSGPEAWRRASIDTKPIAKVQKQTHFEAKPRSGPEAAEGPGVATGAETKNAKTNPLSSMFTGNRHERRRAKALARKQRKET